MSDVLTDALRLDISAEASCNGRHIVRWTEQVTWGVKVHLITAAAPEDIAQAHEDFSLFCALPPVQRQAAADAVRWSAERTCTVLRRFMPPLDGELQQSLF